MTSIQSPVTELPADLALPTGPDHLLGVHDEGLPGATIVVVAGLHGNEPAGVQAFQRVLRRLRDDGGSFRGRLVGLAGNLEALRRSQRFIDEDLNRIWQRERVESVAAGTVAATVEGRQQVELLAQLTTELARVTAPVHFLDLHTSSAPGKPFVCIGDTLRNRRFAMSLPVPVILGLEEQVDGALLEYVNNRGHITIGVEAGQHDDPASVDFHEAFLELALVEAGCVDEDPSRHPGLRERLGRSTADLPGVLEVRHRHPVTANDAFTMRPGFQNFDPIESGEVVAQDVAGDIRAPEKGRVLLPLYQGLGDDGYFLVREFARSWLAVSAFLRHLHADRIAPWLPGVHVRDDDPDTLVVDRRVARWFTVEVFHLLGYRKERSGGRKLLFSRRLETL